MNANEGSWTQLYRIGVIGLLVAGALYRSSAPATSCKRTADRRLPTWCSSSFERTASQTWFRDRTAASATSAMLSR